MVQPMRMASRYLTAGETRLGSGRINPARATDRAMVLNQLVDQFDPLALIGPVTEIVPGTSAMQRFADLQARLSEGRFCANNRHSRLIITAMVSILRYR
jgi:hypothetical protein